MQIDPNDTLFDVPILEMRAAFRRVAGLQTFDRDYLRNLFGSYLSDKPTIGDIDVAFTTKRKIENYDEFNKDIDSALTRQKSEGVYLDGIKMS